MVACIRTQDNDLYVLQAWQSGNSKWRSLSCAAPSTAGDFAGNPRRTARIHLVLQSLHDTFGLRPRFLGSVSNGL